MCGTKEEIVTRGEISAVFAPLDDLYQFHIDLQAKVDDATRLDRYCSHFSFVMYFLIDPPAPIAL